MTPEVAALPPKVCRQESVTFPPDAVAKYAQTLPHASDEWHAIYSTLRNTIEGTNGFAKDGAWRALGDAQRRRIRGRAAQTVFVAFLLFAANLRKIDVFRELAVVGDDGALRLPRRRRTTSPVSDWLPTPPRSGTDPPAPA